MDFNVKIHDIHEHRLISLTMQYCLPTHVQFVNEFNRVIESQHSSFLSCKLKWLELQPRIIAAAESERDNPNLQFLG